MDQVINTRTGTPGRRFYFASDGRLIDASLVKAASDASDQLQEEMLHEFGALEVPLEIQDGEAFKITLADYWLKKVEEAKAVFAEEGYPEAYLADILTVLGSLMGEQETYLASKLTDVRLEPLGTASVLPGSSSPEANLPRSSMNSLKKSLLVVFS